MRARLGDLSERLGGELIGDADAEVARIAPLEAAGPDAIAFLSNPRYQPQLATSQAGCVIVGPALREAAAARGAAIVGPDPELAFARLTPGGAAQQRRPAEAGVHASAVVEPGAFIDATASIGALSYIGRGARIGAGVVIEAHGHLAEGAELGEGSWLKPRVTLGLGCRIGARGIVHSGAVIGADGFGFAPHEGRWEKIEQLGAVVVGDDVEIGANTCIDRGALGETVIDHGVKLDNLIQIAHNVRIGAHTAVAGCTGIAGSTRIGRRCTIAGAAMIIGHLEIVDDVHITVGTVVSRSILKPGRYSGSFPFDDNAAWEKNAATLRQLHSLRERVRALEKNS